MPSALFGLLRRGSVFKSPMLLQVVFSLFLLIVSILPACANPPPVECNVYWVAAQDVGNPNSFFTKDHKAVLAADINVGDTLVSDRPIYVRPKAADWKNILFTLRTGSAVFVGAKTSLDAKDQKQIWLSIVTVGPRLPASQPSRDISVRRKFWEQQAFYCKVGSDTYPSKNDCRYNPFERYDERIPKEVREKQYISNNCDDGDSTFYNGLLCAAGEARGCYGVALAQDMMAGPDHQKGRWWRSKRRIGDIDDSTYSSFSTDHALGVYAYVIKTGDKDRFLAWLNYLKATQSIYAPSPTYCPNKECVFKAIDCPLLITVASAFGSTEEALSVCNPLRILGIPTPDQLAADLRGGLDSAIAKAAQYQTSFNKLVHDFSNAFGLPDPTSLQPNVAAFQAAFDAPFEAYKKANAELLGPLMGDAAARLAESVTLANSYINSEDISGADPGFVLNPNTGKVMITFSGKGVTIDGSNVLSGQPQQLTATYNPNGQHLASVEVFLLRSLGYDSPELHKAADNALERDRDNPFFQYLVDGQNSARARQLILDKCPSKEAPSVSRFQWFPERGEEVDSNRKKVAWEESMYWDCIFLSNLVEHGVSAALSPKKIDLDPFGLLADPLKKLLDVLSEVNAKVSEIDQKIREIADKFPGPKLPAEICDNLPKVGPPHPGCSNSGGNQGGGGIKPPGCDDCPSVKLP